MAKLLYRNISFAVGTDEDGDVEAEFHTEEELFALGRGIFELLPLEGFKAGGCVIFPHRVFQEVQISPRPRFARLGNKLVLSSRFRLKVNVGGRGLKAYRLFNLFPLVSPVTFFLLLDRSVPIVSAAV